MKLTTERGYLFRVSMSISIVLCTMFGGKPYETVCAAAWRLQNCDNPIKRALARFTIRTANLLEENHCRMSSRIHQRLMFGLKHSKSQQKRVVIQSG